MSVVRALQNMGIPDGSVAGEVLDGTVILFDEVNAALVLAHQDVDAGVSLDTVNCGRVGAALLYG